MPIDQEFRKKLKVSGTHSGHNVWGPTDPPKKLGIHGTICAVDQDICDGDGVCVEVCPMSVYDLIETPGNPVSGKKSDPMRENDCIFCLACETQCHVQAIKITPP
jgi:NAD-dependent dihydropyrimidine dehydrogenase PreA subunit